jgi:hypothetical protein
VGEAHLRTSDVESLALQNWRMTNRASASTRCPAAATIKGAIESGGTPAPSTIAEFESQADRLLDASAAGEHADAFDAALILGDTARTSRHARCVIRQSSAWDGLDRSLYEAVGWQLGQGETTPIAAALA